MIPKSGDNSIAKDQLKAFIERIERLEEERAATNADIGEVYAEAKGNGFDTKIMRAVVRMRKKEAHEREEEERLIDLYMYALGMVVFEDTELGKQTAKDQADR